MAAGSSAQSTIQTQTELGEWEDQEGGRMHLTQAWSFHVGLAKADKPHGMSNNWWHNTLHDRQGLLETVLQNLQAHPRALQLLMWIY